jgi:hypothetical protein
LKKKLKPINNFQSNKQIDFCDDPPKSFTMSSPQVKSFAMRDIPELRPIQFSASVPNTPKTKELKTTPISKKEGELLVNIENLIMKGSKKDSNSSPKNNKSLLRKRNDTEYSFGSSSLEKPAKEMISTLEETNELTRCFSFGSGDNKKLKQDFAGDTENPELKVHDKPTQTWPIDELFETSGYVQSDIEHFNMKFKFPHTAPSDFEGPC